MVIDGMLPILLVFLSGFLLAQFNFFSLNAAKEINRMVFFFGMPLVGISMLTKADFSAFNNLLLFSYLISQFLTGILGGFLALYIWKFDLKSAALVGMSTALANHLLFILPIAKNIYSGYIIEQISAIIVVDVIVITFIVTLILEYASAKQISLKKLVKRMLSIPLVIGVIIGIALAISNIELPAVINSFLDFSYASAAPMALFALGVTLAKSELMKNPNFIISISLIKVLLHPIFILVIALVFFQISLSDLKPALMVAAAPCGAMVLVFAAAYDDDPKPLAPLVVISFLLSLPGVALALLI